MLNQRCLVSPFITIVNALLGNTKPLIGAIQMTVIGALAAGAAFGIAKVIPQA